MLHFDWPSTSTTYSYHFRWSKIFRFCNILLLISNTTLTQCFPASCVYLTWFCGTLWSGHFSPFVLSEQTEPDWPAQILISVVGGQSRESWLWLVGHLPVAQSSLLVALKTRALNCCKIYFQHSENIGLVVPEPAWWVERNLYCMLAQNVSPVTPLKNSAKDNSFARLKFVKMFQPKYSYFQIFRNAGETSQ